MQDIQAITCSDTKSNICNTVLRALPDWFGIEQSIVDYVYDVQQMPFYAALDGETTVGFIAVKDHNPYTAEVHVMGILPTHHRRGLGAKLIRQCEEYCAESGKRFLTVKTLDASAEYEPYDRSRNFYLAQGFIPVEVFPQIWGESNPCLMLIKPVGY